MGLRVIFDIALRIQFTQLSDKISCSECPGSLKDKIHQIFAHILLQLQLWNHDHLGDWLTDAPFVISISL